MRLRLAITLTLGDKPPPPDDITVDLVGTHHDIPAATDNIGFQPDDRSGQ